MAKFARELGFKPVSTVSNGLILNQFSDCLLENFQLINISLDGYDNRTYSKHRGGDGLFDKVIYNIGELVRKRKSTSSQLHISVVHVIYEENLYDIEKMITLAEKLNVDRIVFKNFHPVQGDYQACTPLHAENNNNGKRGILPITILLLFIQYLRTIHEHTDGLKLSYKQ